MTQQCVFSEAVEIESGWWYCSLLRARKKSGLNVTLSQYFTVGDGEVPGKPVSPSPGLHGLTFYLMN